MNKNRFEAFSDGVFAIAATLLVLELHIPQPHAGSPDQGLFAGLLGLWPIYIVYVATFATIGIMWFNHHALFHNVERVTYPMAMFNLLLLLLVSFLPFSIEVFSRFGLSPVAAEFNGLISLLIAVAFGVLYYVAAPGVDEPRTFARYFLSWRPWNTLGPLLYIGGIIVARWSPLLSVSLYAIAAVYYAAPSATRHLIRSQR